MDGRSIPRLTAAGLVTIVSGLLAAGFWLVARAQYLEDYCTSRVQPPATRTPEALSGRPAYLDGPWTVRCEYDGFPAVDVTDPLPFLGALVLVAAVLGVAALAFGRARRTRYSEPPSSRATVS